MNSLNNYSPENPPGRCPMAPPELSGDAPVSTLVLSKKIVPDTCKIGRIQAQVVFFHSLGGKLT